MIRRIHPTDRDDNYVEISKEDYALGVTLFPKVWAVALFSEADDHVKWLFKPLLRGESSQAKITRDIYDKYSTQSAVNYVVGLVLFVSATMFVYFSSTTLSVKIMVIIGLIFVGYIGYLRKQLAQGNEKLAFMLLNKLLDKT